MEAGNQSTCTPLFTAAQSTTASPQNQPVSIDDEHIEKMWYMNTMEHFVIYDCMDGFGDVMLNK